MEIHQVLVSASRGDAVTNAAFELRALLRESGPSEIYARYYESALHDEVRPLDTYDRRPTGRSADDVVVFHCSIGDLDVFRFVRDRPERLVLVYHNISPASAFVDHDPPFAALLEDGRRQLAVLAGKAHAAVADSEYNAEELRALGCRDVRVVPLVLGFERLLQLEPHPATTYHLREGMEGPLVLFVGQLLPHKRPDLVVEAYHVLLTYLLPHVNLALVGPSRLPAYRRSLQAFVYELNLAHAWITGPVSDAELVAFYRRADVFVTASEHEGFCVPLVEAMAFDVPMVTRARAAIPETAGDAALMLPPTADPVLLAETTAAVLTDARLAGSLRQRGRARLPVFSPEQARAAWRSRIAELA